MRATCAICGARWQLALGALAVLVALDVAPAAAAERALPCDALRGPPHATVVVPLNATAGRRARVEPGCVLANTTLIFELGDGIDGEGFGVTLTLFTLTGTGGVMFRAANASDAALGNLTVLVSDSHVNVSGPAVVVVAPAGGRVANVTLHVTDSVLVSREAAPGGGAYAAAVANAKELTDAVLWASGGATTITATAGAGGVAAALGAVSLNISVDRVRLMVSGAAFVAATGGIASAAVGVAATTAASALNVVLFASGNATVRAAAGSGAAAVGVASPGGATVSSATFAVSGNATVAAVASGDYAAVAAVGVASARRAMAVNATFVVDGHATVRAEGEGVFRPSVATVGVASFNAAAASNTTVFFASGDASVTAVAGGHNAVAVAVAVAGHISVSVSHGIVFAASGNAAVTAEGRGDDCCATAVGVCSSNYGGSSAVSNATFDSSGNATVKATAKHSSYGAAAVGLASRDSPIPVADCELLACGGTVTATHAALGTQAGRFSVARIVTRAFGVAVAARSCANAPPGVNWRRGGQSVFAGVNAACGVVGYGPTRPAPRAAAAVADVRLNGVVLKGTDLSSRFPNATEGSPTPVTGDEWLLPAGAPCPVLAVPALPALPLEITLPPPPRTPTATRDTATMTPVHAIDDATRSPSRTSLHWALPTSATQPAPAPRDGGTTVNEVVTQIPAAPPPLSPPPPPTTPALPAIANATTPPPPFRTNVVAATVGSVPALTVGALFSAAAAARVPALGASLRVATCAYGSSDEPSRFDLPLYFRLPTGHAPLELFAGGVAASVVAVLVALLALAAAHHKRVCNQGPPSTDDRSTEDARSKLPATDFDTRRLLPIACAVAMS